MGSTSSFLFGVFLYPKLLFVFLNYLLFLGACYIQAGLAKGLTFVRQLITCTFVGNQCAECEKQQKQ